MVLLRNSKEPLIVHTPFNTFRDMYIQSLILRQNNQKDITDIEISLKQLSFLNSQTTEANSQKRESCNFIQRDTVENHGIVQGISEVDGGGGMNITDVLKASVTYEVFK